MAAFALSFSMYITAMCNTPFFFYRYQPLIFYPKSHQILPHQYIITACTYYLLPFEGINIHVYERGGQQGGFDRVAAFDHPSSPESR